MSSNIAKGGYELRLFDIDVARASAVAADIGATAVDEITGLESCDVIVTMLPTSAIVRATLLDDEGACASHCGRARSSQT